MRQFELTEIQATAILDMKLQRLTQLERNKLIEEYQELLKRMEYLRSVLGSETLVRKIIKEELQAIKEEYKDERRTQIVSGRGGDQRRGSDRRRGSSRDGDSCRLYQAQSVSLYRAQRRGGKGKIGMGVKEEDFVETLFTASTHDYLLFFTRCGKSLLAEGP